MHQSFSEYRNVIYVYGKQYIQHACVMYIIYAKMGLLLQTLYFARLTVLFKCVCNVLHAHNSIMSVKIHINEVTH